MVLKDWVEMIQYDDELQFLIKCWKLFTPEDQVLLKEIASKRMNAEEAKAFIGVQ